MSKGNGKLASIQQSQEAKRVHLAEWRASRIHERILPSGLPVKIRDVSMTDLMLTGRLPDAIMSMASDAAQNGEQEFDLAKVMNNTAQFNAMLNTLVELCLVDPKIGTVADDEHILLAELPADDKLDIFNFVNRGAEQLRPFREGEAKPVASI